MMFAEKKDRNRPHCYTTDPIAHCYVSDPEKQMKCDGYWPHPRVGKDYCWFCYDVWNNITDQCFRPGALEVKPC